MLSILLVADAQCSSCAFGEESNKQKTQIKTGSAVPQSDIPDGEQCGLLCSCGGGYYGVLSHHAEEKKKAIDTASPMALFLGTTSCCPIGRGSVGGQVGPPGAAVAANGLGFREW